MPIMRNDRFVSFHEPLSEMDTAELRDYANAIRPFAKLNPITVERKLKDIEAEIEWRRAAHSEKAGRP